METGQMARNPEQDAWILKHFHIDVAKYDMKGKNLESQGHADEAAGARVFAQGKALLDRVDGERRRVQNSDLPGNKQHQSSRNVTDFTTHGQRLEEVGADQYKRGVGEVEQGREALELVDVAKKSFVAAQRGGIEIKMLSLSVAAYCGGALSGGFVMVRITSANNPNIPDINFTMPIDKLGLARWPRPLVVSSVGKISFNVAPPAWLAKMLPGGELNHEPFFYNVKEKEDFLSFKAVQGKSAIGESTGNTDTTGTTTVKGKSSSKGGGWEGGLNVEGEGGVKFPVDGTLKIAPHLNKTTSWQELTNEEKQELTSGSKDHHTTTNYVGPLFDLVVSQDHR